MSLSNHIVCKRCLLSSENIKQINFDEKGNCNYCNNFFEGQKQYLAPGKEQEFALQQLVDKISADGKNKPYNCIVGLSGGVDSSYVAYWAWKAGLKPLAVHFDNGWNSELAVSNIENIIKTTGFDLYTYVVNWNEFRDLQRAYFKAGVIDIEVPTDHMIFATLFKVANKNNIKYLLSGTNHATEGILPKEWVYSKIDLLNIQDIHKKFGEIELKEYPKLGALQRSYYTQYKKIQFVEPLNLQPYNKKIAKETIIKEFGWRDYGGKHYESVFTKFYQGYVLPNKFKVDKRAAHLATLICNGELTQQQAIDEMQQPPIALDEVNEVYNYAIKKLGFTKEEFDAIMAATPVPHEVYENENNPSPLNKLKIKVMFKLCKILFG